MKLSTHGHNIFLAIENQDFGHVAFYRNEREIFVSSLALLPQARGGGLGSLLINIPIRIGRVFGPRLIRLEAGAEVLGFYLACGFEVSESKGDRAFLVRKV